jgi:hypothetical protein
MLKSIGVALILLSTFSAVAATRTVLLTCPRNANGNSGTLYQDEAGQIKFDFKRPNYRKHTINIVRASYGSYYTARPKRSTDGTQIPAITIEKAEFGHTRGGWYRASISAEYVPHYETTEHYLIDCEKP